MDITEIIKKIKQKELELIQLEELVNENEKLFKTNLIKLEIAKYLLQTLKEKIKDESLTYSSKKVTN